MQFPAGRCVVKPNGEGHFGEESTDLSIGQHGEHDMEASLGQGEAEETEMSRGATFVGTENATLDP